MEYSGTSVDGMLIDRFTELRCPRMDPFLKLNRDPGENLRPVFVVEATPGKKSPSNALARCADRSVRELNGLRDAPCNPIDKPVKSPTPRGNCRNGVARAWGKSWCVKFHR